jgi:hypothetical protein
MPTRERRLRMEQDRLRREQAARGDLPVPVGGPPTAEAFPDQEEEPMAVQTDQPMVWVRFTVPGLGFFTYHDTNYDRGQLMPLIGGPRDEQLQRMGYVQPAPKEESHLHAQCGVCGVWFVAEQFRDLHGRLRHSDRFAPADIAIGGGMAGPDGGTALRDVTGDAEERRMQQQYPLYMDKTRATLDSSPA